MVKLTVQLRDGRLLAVAVSILGSLVGCHSGAAQTMKAGVGCAGGAYWHNGVPCRPYRCAEGWCEVSDDPMMEPVEGLRILARRAKFHFEVVQMGDDQGNLQAHVFPEGETEWVPSTPCCQRAGALCRPEAGTWDRKPWKLLDFRFRGAHRCQWRYSASGKGSDATFVAEARGDIDCDGEYATYQIRGRVNEDLVVVVEGPDITNAWE